MDFSQVSKIRLEGKPYDAEVEYLESTGTQWIDTGVYGNQDTKMECTMRFPSYTSTTGEGRVFGARGASHSNEFSFGGQSGVVISGGGWYSGFGNGQFINGLGTVDLLTHTATVSKDGVLIDGVSIGTFNQMSFTTLSTMHVFGFSGETGLGKTIVYGLKIWQADTIVRDFIPVRKNGVGYFYDKVSGHLFGNQGTGAFLYGSDVRCYSVAKIERGSTTLWKKRPYDAEVEYLESVEGAKIETNYYPTSNFSFVADAYIPNRSWLFISGNDYNTNTMGLFGASTGSNLILRTPGRNNDLTGAANRRVHIAYSDGMANVDGVDYPVASFSRTPDFLQRIFIGGSVKLYSLKFYESNTLKLDLHPVRVGTTGCLYDKVSGELFGNAGTGEFLYGADLEGSNS